MNQKQIGPRPAEGPAVHSDDGDREIAPGDRAAGVAGDIVDGAASERGQLRADQGHSAPKVNRSASSTAKPSTTPCGDRAADGNSGPRKVSRMRLSGLQRFILVRAANGGVERADVLAEFFNLERRYLGHYADPMYYSTKEREHKKRYRRAQPSVSRSLGRLESRGLVQLTRTAGKYIKKIELTPEGRALATALAAEEGIKEEQTLGSANVSAPDTDTSATPLRKDARSAGAMRGDTAGPGERIAKYGC